jgi:hypothetical protein
VKHDRFKNPKQKHKRSTNNDKEQRTIPKHNIRGKNKNNTKETGSKIKNKKQKQQNGIIKNIHKINDENGKQTTKTKGKHHV